MKIHILFSISFGILLNFGNLSAEDAGMDVCRQNLERIFQAFTAYAEDHGGFLPQLTENSDNGVQMLWPELLKTYLNDSSPEGHVDPQGPFFCPNVPVESRRSGKASTISYGYNSLIFGQGKRISFKSIPEPSKTLLLVEAEAPKQPGDGWYSAYPNGGIRFARHGEFAMVLFCDGSIKKITQKELDNKNTAVSPWFSDIPAKIGIALPPVIRTPKKYDPEVEKMDDKNLSRLYKAFLDYAQENNGFFPALTEKKENGEIVLWPESLKSFLDDVSPENYVDPSGPFFSAAVSDDDRRGGKTSTVSYGYNRLVFGTESPVRLSDIPDPSKTILLVESEALKQPGDGWYEAYPNAGLIFARNGEYARVLFCDGSIGKMKDSELNTDGKSIPWCEGLAPVKPTPPGKWESLGTPVRLSQIYKTVIYTDKSGSQMIIFGMRDAINTFLLFVDPYTGKTKQIDLNVKGQVWDICTHSTGRIFATVGSGPVFEIDVQKGQSRLIAMPPPGQIVIWQLLEASDGHIYGGTHPGCKLVRLNVNTMMIEDLGRIDPDRPYANRCAVKGDYVYVGCGVVTPAVWAYNIKTGNKKQLLPEKAQQFKYFGTAEEFSDGNIYIRGGDSTGTSLHFRVDGENTTEISQDNLPAQKRLVLKNGDEIVISGTAGPEKKFIRRDKNGQEIKVAYDYTCTSTQLWDVFNGPDGLIYGTTHTPITLFRFNPDTKKTEIFVDPVGHAGQIYKSIWYQGTLHMTAYSKATYTVWNPARPWSAVGTNDTDNPQRIGSTTRDIQRTGDMIIAPDGRQIIIGGQPGYGAVGGGMMIADPEKREFNLYKGVAGDQSIRSLSTTPDDSIIAIGTSRYAGSGAVQQMSSGRIIFWDWKKRKIISEFSPWDDVAIINTLIRLGNNLYILGEGPGRLGVYDFISKKMIRQSEIGRFTPHHGTMVYSAEHNLFFVVINGNRLYSINPGTLKAELLGAYPNLLTPLVPQKDYIYGVTPTDIVRFKIK